MPNVPFDYATQAEELKRKRALYDNIAQGLMQQKQGQMISGHYVGPGIADAIGQVASAYFMKKGNENLDAAQGQLRQDYKDNLKQGMDDYFNTRNGAAAVEKPYSQDQIQNLMQNDQDLPPQEIQPAIKADPRAAAVQAVVSGFPELQELGMQDLKQLGKTAEPVAVKDLLSHATPESIKNMLTQGTAAFEGKSDLKNVGDVVYDPNTRTIVPLKGPAPTQETIGGDLYQKSPSTGELKKLDNAPKVSVNSSFSPVIGGQKKGVEAYFTHAAGQVDALGKTATQSEQLLNTLGTLRQLHQAGINGNITSDAVTAAANLAQGLGLKLGKDAVAKLGNTETYNSLITDLWQRSVSQMGGNRGVTKEEAEEIKKLTPMAKNSPQAREQLFALHERAAQRSIDAYKQANKSFAEAAAADDPRMFQIPGMVEGTYVPPAAAQPNPQMPLPPSAAPMSWEDYKASLGAK